MLAANKKIILDNFLLSITIVLIIFSIPLPVRNFSLVLSNIHCKSYGNYVKNFSCTFDKTPPPRINIDVQMQRRVDDQRLDFIVQLERPKLRDTYLLYRSLGVKGCDLFSQKTTNPIINSFKDVLLRTGPLPKECPVKADFHYRFLNITLNADFLPTFIPEGGFKVVVTSYDKKFMYLNTTTQGQVVHRNKNTNKKKRPR